MKEPNPYAPPCSSVAHQSVAAAVHRLGAIRLAALIGGPIAAGYLVWQSLRSLHQQKQMRSSALLFGTLFLIWLYAIFSVPPDFISQLIPFVLQVPIWWLGAQYMLAKPLHEYIERNGVLQSWWAAVRVALLVFASVKITFFVLIRFMNIE